MLAAMHTCLALFAGARSPRIALQHRAGSAQMLDLHAVDGLYQSFPYPAAFATCATKAACSDAISQKTVERVVAENGAVTEHTFCMSRNAAFTLYGGLYQGCAQYYIFNELYPSLFGTSTDVATVAIKVAFDQLVLTPFLCLPLAYLVKALVFRTPLSAGLARYVTDARRDLLWKYWAIWTPAQCLTFSVVPDHLRIPFIACISFFWLIILSNITSRPKPSGPGKAIICYDNEGIIIDEIDDEFGVSVLDVADRGVLRAVISDAVFSSPVIAGGNSNTRRDDDVAPDARMAMSGQEAFAMLDEDCGGSVSVDELQRALRAGTSTALSEAEVSRLTATVVDAFDENGDGELQLAEFQVFWKDLHVEDQDAAASKSSLQGLD